MSYLTEFDTIIVNYKTMAKKLVQCNYCANTLKKKTKPIDMNNKYSVYNHKRLNPDCKEDLRRPRPLKYAKPFIEEAREQYKKSLKRTHNETYRFKKKQEKKNSSK